MRGTASAKLTDGAGSPRLSENVGGQAPSGQPGGPKKFSDLSIETALTLGLVLRLPLRQTEGFLRSLLLVLMGTALEAPDHTTLSRRRQQLDIGVRPVPSRGPIPLIVDSTALSIVGGGARG